VPAERGESVVVVPVPAAEPLVSAWRERFDPSAAERMPAHVTALAPFLREERLTGEVLARLRELCADVPVLDVVFRRTARFPDVLYLAPEPDDVLHRLTLAIAEQWPQAPPYRGAFDDVIPHLTVACGAGDDVFAAIEGDLVRGLPVEARLAEACLYVSDGAQWRVRARLPFKGREVHRNKQP
jgi:hypothetical protein